MLVCATPVDGIPEAIKNMETGLLFEVDDVESLKKCVELMMSDNNLYNSISEKAKSLVD